MRVLASLALLTALSVVVDGNSPSTGQLKSSGQVESVRRRGGPSQAVRMAPRGRKKSIWSYNPGHRSLAFLVAGEVVSVSPPPLEPGTGDYRCLGCCGDKVTIPGKANAAPKISNRVSKIVVPSEGFGNLGTEPNSINDRCLGCCRESVTPSLRVTPVTERGTPTGPQRGVTAGKQRPQQGRGHEPPCIPPKCNPDWRYESSSSSEEVPVRRHRRPATSRLQPIEQRTGNLCRHLGCRSSLGLGAAPDSSSSSEED